MNNKEIFNYSNNFLQDIIEDLIEDKKKYLTNPKANDFNRKFISIFGKSFTDEEINELIKLNEKDFYSKINNKFQEKRNGRIEQLGKDRAEQIEKGFFLQIVDMSWKSHIQYLEQLRQVIGLRSYGQRDPLVEYKKEAYSLFENLLFKLKSDLVTVLLNLEVVQQKQEPIKNNTNNDVSFKKIGRNEPCPCNSGKKYKHCHGSL